MSMILGMFSELLQGVYKMFLPISRIDAVFMTITLVQNRFDIHKGIIHKKFIMVGFEMLLHI